MGSNACACCGPTPETITKIGSATSNAVLPTPATAQPSVHQQPPMLEKKGIEPLSTPFSKNATTTEDPAFPDAINPAAKSKFTFGRSESKVEEMLRGKGCSTPASTPASAAPAQQMSSGSASSDAPPLPPGLRKRRASVDGAVQVHVTAAPSEATASSPSNAARGRTLSLETIRLLETMFHKMDLDKSGEIKYDEAIQYWCKSFAKVSTEAMFNEVDADQDGSVTLEEFMSFWQGIKQSGVSDDELTNEIQLLLQGNAWVPNQNSTAQPGAALPAG